MTFPHACPTPSSAPSLRQGINRGLQQRASRRAPARRARAPRATRASGRRFAPRRGRARRTPPSARRPRARRRRSRRDARARGASASAARASRRASTTSAVRLPSRRSSPAGLPIATGSPKIPSTSSRSWKAMPSGSANAASASICPPARAREARANHDRPADRVARRLQRVHRLDLARVARGAPARRAPAPRSRLRARARARARPGRRDRAAAPPRRTAAAPRRRRRSPARMLIASARAAPKCSRIKAGTLGPPRRTSSPSIEVVVR